MFEHWSERRRRWFLIAFSATAWLLFADSLAGLGRQFADGGIGPDGFHTAAVIATISGWAIIWSAFQLSLRHWAFAVLFGISLNAALLEFGLRDHAAAAIWAVECDRGAGAACQNLAEYYDSGRSPLHGGLDALTMRTRACALGGEGTAASCVLTERLHPAVSVDSNATSDRCVSGYSEVSCLRSAHAASRAGDLSAADFYFDKACQLSKLGRAPTGCIELLDTGVPHTRLEACERIDVVCRTSATRDCEIAVKRCDRFQSPHAGTD